MTPLLGGSTTVFPFFFPDTVATMKAIHEFKCNSLRGPPTIFFDLLNHPERSKFDLSSLDNALFGGSTCPPDLLKRLRDELNLKQIIVGYGMTETSLCATLTTATDVNRSHKFAYESVGRPLPSTEVKIVDPKTKQILPLNTDGELCIRGYNMMKGYWDEAEKTKETIDENGWLHTGDIMHMDEHGYLYFKTRVKDLIIRGGANVYPAEVEMFLRRNPKILDVHVFGVPCDRLGEDICAWIKLKPDCSLSYDELKEFCAGNIAHFKVPKYMKIVDAFPVNATGKVLKMKMAEMAKAELKL